MSFEGWGAAVAITAAAGVAEGAVSANAAEKAAEAQETAADKQIALEQQEFAQEQQNEAPYLAAGDSALQQLVAGFGANGQFNQAFTANNFQSSPQYQGYLFQQQQGNAQRNAAAAAKGQNFSPATSEALMAFNQNLASTSYQNWYDSAYTQWQNQQTQEISGLQNLTQGGQNAVSGVNQAGQAATAAENASLGAYGNAKAAGTLGAAAGLNQAIGAVGSAASAYATGGMSTAIPTSYPSQPTPTSGPQSQPGIAAAGGNPDNLGGATDIYDPNLAPGTVQTYAAGTPITSAMLQQQYNSNLFNNQSGMTYQQQQSDASAGAIPYEGYNGLYTQGYQPITSDSLLQGGPG